MYQVFAIEQTLEQGCYISNSYSKYFIYFSVIIMKLLNLKKYKLTTIKFEFHNCYAIYWLYCNVIMY